MRFVIPSPKNNKIDIKNIDILIYSRLTQHITMHTPHQQQQLHASSISTTTIEDDDDMETPKVPRGRRSDITEKDLEELTRSFSYGMAMSGYIEE